MPYKEIDKWRAGVTVKGVRGPTRLFKTKREAIQYETQERKRLAKIERQQQKGMALFDFCTKYLDFAERYTRKVYDEKNAVCNRILEAWGAITPVASISTEMIEQYLIIQKKARSANAANKDRKNLLSMWNKGIKTYGLKSNPIIGTEKFPHDRKPQYTPPTADILKLLAVATRKELIFLHCYIFTGARRSEIFRWTWVDDINLENMKYRLGTRKTRDGSMEHEWFPMPPELHESLSWWWQHRTIKTSPYVFTDDQIGPHYGKPYKERRRFMHGLCKRSKIKAFGFHALRRFFASRLADMGKATPTIQKLLRHKKVTTTERYIHNINNDLRGVTDGLLAEINLHESLTHKQEKANHENG
jgi:integrase